jgi:hypothetical protein
MSSPVQSRLSKETPILTERKGVPLRKRLKRAAHNQRKDLLAKAQSAVMPQKKRVAIAKEAVNSWDTRPPCDQVWVKSKQKREKLKWL